MVFSARDMRDMERGKNPRVGHCAVFDSKRQVRYMGGTRHFCRNQKLFAYARMGFVIVWFPVTKRFF